MELSRSFLHFQGHLVSTMALKGRVSFLLIFHFQNKFLIEFHISPWRGRETEIVTQCDLAVECYTAKMDSGQHLKEDTKTSSGVVDSFTPYMPFRYTYHSLHCDQKVGVGGKKRRETFTQSVGSNPRPHPRPRG